MSRPLPELITDYEADLGQWEVVRIETEPSANRRNRGGTSTQELFRHRITGEELVRHMLRKPNGTLFGDPHFRTDWKQEELTMHALDKTAWEVLNATADDWENLEEIYRQVCFEFSSENFEGKDRGAYYYRPAKGAPMLSELAERLYDLVEAGLLAGRLEESGLPVTDLKDRSFVWRAWFAMTPEGREAWAATEDAALT